MFFLILLNTICLGMQVRGTVLTMGGGGVSTTEDRSATSKRASEREIFPTQQSSWCVLSTLGAKCGWLDMGSPEKGLPGGNFLSAEH